MGGGVYLWNLIADYLVNTSEIIFVPIFNFKIPNVGSGPGQCALGAACCLEIDWQLHIRSFLIKIKYYIKKAYV